MTHPRNQDGFALIEVIVSAAVLAIIALAVLSGIDGATASTARERARAVAASLAEQDQERMRGYRFEELSKIASPAPVTIDGVQYTITSKAEWVADDGVVADETCGAAGAKQSEYLRITSTVESAMVGARIPKVKMESLVSPPVSGSLVVKLEGGVPARIPAGITVTAIAKTTGRTYTAVSNSQGCAVFRTIETGDYTIRLNTPGWVDKKPAQLSEKTATVNSALMSVITMPYDRAINMRVSVKTLKPGVAFPNATTYDSKTLSVADTSADSPNLKKFSLASPGSTLDITNQFPFGTGYSFFTGTCPIQSPVKTGDKDYFSLTNKNAVILGDPDSPVKPQLATVFQPALNLRVRASSTNASPPTSTFDATGMRVYVYLQPINGEGCAELQGTELAIKNWPTTIWTTNPLNDTNRNRNWVFQAGTSTEFDPGLPFGTYEICLRDGNKWWATAGTTTGSPANPHYDNTKTSRATMEIPPSGTATSAWKDSAAQAGCGT
ncbi:carboxypeptidase-like regulatory domain-containing protein [Solirubrobacter phytolaccae]|uniref:Carboxypeptidase-like regulatory domain-containing protein n=1 Tax=Solirubrobacter phytolaccae TaxID=1404360 RepID=A0A9X3S7U2_9ACTN|nr:carboxypeptidase-like regulatory domain-containing protein [Solirubrobacter phytolaccae]MDA0181429.1 carboxypeptidase-like regulatory domain-containing protein [Solirubrobacter phytolaccae]